MYRMKQVSPTGFPASTVCLHWELYSSQLMSLTRTPASTLTQDSKPNEILQFIRGDGVLICTSCKYAVQPPQSHGIERSYTTFSDLEDGLLWIMSLGLNWDFLNICSDPKSSASQSRSYRSKKAFPIIDAGPLLPISKEKHSPHLFIPTL